MIVEISAQLETRLDASVFKSIYYDGISPSSVMMSGLSIGLDNALGQ